LGGTIDGEAGCGCKNVRQAEAVEAVEEGVGREQVCHVIKFPKDGAKRGRCRNKAVTDRSDNGSRGDMGKRGNASAMEREGERNGGPAVVV
jgi:hypothetical protein